MSCCLYLTSDFYIPNYNHSPYLLWYLMITGAEPATWMLLWSCETLTTHLFISCFPTGLCFKVSGLHKIPQRPAFILFSSINNLLLLCFSLQSKEKPILYIKIERSVAERSVMAFSGARSILPSSGRGIAEHKQFLPVHPPPLLGPCVREGDGVTGPQLCLSRRPHCPRLGEFVSWAVSLF